ncbi:MAG: hypothetical protein V7739_06820 [Motiliproteus sp.]
MKIRTLVNILILGSIAMLIYSLVGYRYVKFYGTGKTEILAVAAQITELCNSNRSCPNILDGWQPLHGERQGLVKDEMWYFVNSDETGSGVGNQEFTMVYSFFEPDHWYEVQGGVGKPVTSGWKNR